MNAGHIKVFVLNRDGSDLVALLGIFLDVNASSLDVGVGVVVVVVIGEHNGDLEARLGRSSVGNGNSVLSDLRISRLNGDIVDTTRRNHSRLVLQRTCGAINLKPRRATDDRIGQLIVPVHIRKECTQIGAGFQ